MEGDRDHHPSLTCNLCTPCDLDVKDRRLLLLDNFTLTSAYHQDAGLIGDDGKPLGKPKQRRCPRDHNKRRRPQVGSRSGMTSFGTRSPHDATPHEAEDEETKLAMQLMGLPTEFFSNDYANSRRREPDWDAFSSSSSASDNEGVLEEVRNNERHVNDKEKSSEELQADSGLPNEVSKHHMEHTTETLPDHASGSNKADDDPSMIWQQAFDPNYNTYYYYCQATKETQWHPPEEGFVPAPYGWSHHAYCNNPQADVEESHPWDKAETVEASGCEVADQSLALDGISLNDDNCMALECEEKSIKAARVSNDDELDPPSIPKYKQGAEAAVASNIQHDAESFCAVGASKIRMTSCGTKNELESVTSAGYRSRKESTGLLSKGFDDPRGSGTLNSHIRFCDVEDNECEIDMEISKDATYDTQQLNSSNSSLVRHDNEARSSSEEDTRQLELELSPAASILQGEPAPALLMKKYWYQRFSLFTRFKEGIRMDEEAWYSVTPEAIANHQASRCAGGVAVDAFTGAGGNAIALARSCQHVIAIDLSLERLNLAKSNTGVYGMSNKVDFLCADFFRLAPHLKADVVFLSPPWGGPEYSRSPRFEVKHDMGGMGLGLQELLQTASGIVQQASLRPQSDSKPSLFRSQSGVAAFLPRNIDLAQISEIAENVKARSNHDPQSEIEMEVERNILNGKLKGVTLYWGRLSSTNSLSHEEDSPAMVEMH